MRTTSTQRVAVPALRISTLSGSVGPPSSPISFPVQSHTWLYKLRVDPLGIKFVGALHVVVMVVLVEMAVTPLDTCLP